MAFKDSKGSTEDVLFVSENVCFKHHEEVDKCYSDKAEGLDSAPHGR